MATRNDTNQENKAADEAARTTRAVTDEAARVGEQAARAGADVTRRGAEVARDTFQTGLNTASESFQRMADQFTNVLGFNGPQAEELARRSSQNIQAVTEAGSVLARGAQVISQEVFGLIQERLRKNADAVNQLARARSVQCLRRGPRDRSLVGDAENDSLFILQHECPRRLLMASYWSRSLI